MGKYLKMADVFCGDYHAKHIHDESGNGFKFMVAHCLEAEYAAHAINSHDELVESMKHYKQESEQWEVRATKEASRAQDFMKEIERLLEKVSHLESDLADLKYELSDEVD